MIWKTREELVGQFFAEFWNRFDHPDMVCGLKSGGFYHCLAEDMADSFMALQEQFKEVWETFA